MDRLIFLPGHFSVFKIICLAHLVFLASGKIVCAADSDKAYRLNLQNYDGRPIVIKANNWSGIVEELSLFLKKPVTAFVPDVGSAIAKSEFRGDAKSVLAKIARDGKGIWVEWRGNVLLIPDIIPSFFREPLQKDELIQHFPITDVQTRFFQSLDKEQLDALQQGKSISLQKLKKEQIDLLTKLGQKDDPVLGRQLPKYMDGGELTVSLGQTHPLIFFRGKFLNGDRSLEQRAPFVSVQDILSFDLEDQERSVASILKDESSRQVNSGKIFTLAQLSEIINKNFEDGKFQVSTELSGISLVTSKTQWKLSELITVVQAITRSDVRVLGSVAFLTSSNAIIKTYTNSIEELTGSLEANWQVWVSVLRGLKMSPLSTIGRVVRDEILFNPQLISYEHLNDGQKDLVKNDSWNTPPPARLINSEDIHDIEVYFPVVVQMKFSKGSDSLRSEFSPTVHYAWLALRNVSGQKDN